MKTNPTCSSDSLLAEAGFVHRLALALLRDAEMAHDVAQDALAAAMQRAEPPHSWRGWLSTVTRRLAAKARQARRNRAQREAMAARGEADDGGHSAAERLQLHERLTQSLLALPEPYRTVVTHRFLDGMPPREIARRMGQTSEVVRQQVHRGLAMLRERLDTGFGDRSVWTRAFVAAGLTGQPVSMFALTVPTMMKSCALVAVPLILACAWWIWPRAAEPSLPAVTASVDPTVGDQAMSAAAPSTVATTSVAREAVEPNLVPACEVLVVDVIGAPIGVAEVTCWSAEGTMATGATDDRGLVVFASAGGAGGILVSAAGRQSHCQALPERRGRHVVVLPQGSTVSGLLLIDGQPSPRGVQLRLHTDRPPGPEVPSPMADRLRWEGTSVTTTGHGGSFEFQGLDAGWRGSVALPHDLCLLPDAGGTAAEPRRVTLAEPRRGLIVATTRLPVIAGRVVWSDTGEAVAKTQLTLHCDFVGGVATPSLLATSDREGRFVVGLLPSDDDLFVQWVDPTQRPALERVRLHATAADAAAPTSMTLTGGEANSATAILVTLGRATRTHFLVLDPASKPVAGARVMARAVSNPTTADGRGVFPGRPDDAILVGAAGHRIAPPEPSNAAGTVEDPLVFRLDAGNEVRLRIWTADGKEAPAHDVTVGSQRHLFAGSRFAGELDRLLGGPEITCSAATERLADGSDRLEDFACRGRSDAAGQLVLRSVEPGVDCVAVVHASLGGELVEVPFTTPPFGTAITVDLRIPRAARQVVGCVRDELDRPIAKARVELRGAGRKDRTRVRSAADGSFRFEGVYDSGDLQLAVEAEGHVPYSGPAHDSSRGEATNLIRMSVGREVTVRVVDDTGAVVPIPPRLAPGQGIEGKCDRLRPGEARFHNLPPRPVEFECTLGGILFKVRHDTVQTMAQLRVARPGRVVFTNTTTWPAPASAAVDHWIVVTPLDAPTPPHSVPAAEARSESLLLLPGRYRLELFERGVAAAAGSTTERPLGLSAEITAAAGAEETVTLR